MRSFTLVPLKPGLLIALSGLLATLALPAVSSAADHQEAPGTRADAAADLADVYSWVEDGLLKAIITFDGLQAPEMQPGPTLDLGVRYTLNIDTDGDFLPDHEIHVRFGENQQGTTRMMVQNLPGAPDSFVAPVNRRVHVGDDAKAFVGLRDDPFFFDLEGFNATLQTGTLMFDNTRDSVAGLNATAIALEMRVANLQTDGSTLNVWASTARAEVLR